MTQNLPFEVLRQLRAQGFGRYAHAHAGQLKRAAQHVVVEHDITVERPVVIVRRAAIMRLA